MDLSTLPTAARLTTLGQDAPRWRPGLAARGALHAEVFGASQDGAGVALALALAMDHLRAAAAAGAPGSGQVEEKPLLWVQDKASLARTGRPYRPGLPPALRHRVIHVAAPGVADALFALEEGLRCRDLACVIGEIAGNPRALDLTASRRLGLAVERHGVPLFLVRHDAVRDISSARMRWQVASVASPPPRWNPAAPGVPSWHAELFRSRGYAPGEWTLHDDGQALVAERPGPVAAAAPPDHGDLAVPAGARSLAAR